MGWVFYDTPPHSIAGEIVDLCSFQNADVRLSPVALAKVLEPAQEDPVWYAAVRRELLSAEAKFRAQELGDFAIQGDQSYTFGAVFLTQEDSGGWGYKNMDETSCPAASFAPEVVLSALTPSSSQYSLHWRHRCAQNAALHGDRFVQFQRNIGQKVAA